MRINLIDVLKLNTLVFPKNKTLFCILRFRIDYFIKIDSENYRFQKKAFNLQLENVFYKKEACRLLFLLLYFSIDSWCKRRIKLETIVICCFLFILVQQLIVAKGDFNLTKSVNTYTNENMRNRTYFIFPIVHQRKEMQHAAPTKKRNNIDVFNYKALFVLLLFVFCFAFYLCNLQSWQTAIFKLKSIKELNL